MGFILATTSLRREPTTEKRVPKPGGPSDSLISNWKATLVRGSEVRLLAAKEAWHQIEILGGEIGWVQESSLAQANEVKIATLLQETRTFQRPDLTRLAGHRLPLGTIVFVVREKEQFSLINHPRGLYNSSETWILSNRLTLAKDEVAMARALAKLPGLLAKDQAAAQEIVTLLKDQYPQTTLLPVLQGLVARIPDEPGPQSSPLIPKVP